MEHITCGKNGSECRHGSKPKYFFTLNLTLTLTFTITLKPTPDPNQPLTVTLKALDALKHIFQRDVIIIDNEGTLFIWETYQKSQDQYI